MKRSSKLVVVLLAGLALAFVGWIANEMHIQRNLGPQIQERYGFEIGSPYVRFGHDRREVITIARLDPGGPLHVAGLEEGDIVVEPRSISRLYVLLNAKAGTQVSLTVAEGGDGPPLDDRNLRIVTVRAPCKTTDRS